MSKKIIALFLAVLPVFAFFGCKNALPGKFEPLQIYSASAQAKKGDFSFECRVDCNSYEDTRIEFTSPESLSGLALALSSDGISVSAYGLADKFPADFIGESSPAYILLHALRDGLYSARTFTAAGDGAYTTDVKIGDSTVRISYNEYGEITRIDDFQTGFTVQLSPATSPPPEGTT